MSLFSKGFKKEANTEVEVITEAEVETKPITLTDEQKAVVYSNENNILLIAGAGSGKTRVLTERVKFLLNKGVKPHNIVAITFTNIAAEEMKIRLKDVEGIGDVFIGTIHSFANKIMGNSGESYTIYSRDVENKYVSYLTEKYCKFLTFEKFLKFRDLQELVEQGRESPYKLNGFLLPSEDAERVMLFSKEPEEHIGDTVPRMCKRDNVIDFNQLLLKAKKYFNSINAEVEYLLVDEFQDVGSYEFKFVMGLNAQNNFFVGDDFQSIFGFKGGDVKIFKSVAKREDFKTYFLTKNFRNCSEVLEIAEVVINQVSDKIDKKAEILNTTEGRVEIRTKGHIREVLKALKASDEKYSDWFILVRTNRELFEIVDECLDLEIPYVTFKREGLTLDLMNKMLSKDRVKILTVHTAKGLESPNVILYGNFPIREPHYRKNEEERKVMYVGITRAINNLIILN